MNENEDRLTSITGEFGKYHILWIIILAISSNPFGILLFSNKFLTAKVDFWCSVPEGLNLTKEQWQNISSPTLENGKFDQCNVFDLNYTDESIRPSDNSAIRSCQSWSYDSSTFEVRQ